MEVDIKTESTAQEALLLGGDGVEEETSQHTEFTTNDVELLLGDDDVNAFANESFEAGSSSEGTGAKDSASKDSTNEESSSTEGRPIEGHYSRGGYRGRPFFRGRGYPPGPGYFPRGMRPPFPGAIPRFGRHPPPFAFRGRPPMAFMRYGPRGMFMRPPRPPPGYFHEEEEEEEDESMKDDKDKAEGSSGPKSLMAIKTPKAVREEVKSNILAKEPAMMAPLGMGMGPRFHLRGPRPPPGAIPPGAVPPGGPPRPPPPGAFPPGGPPPHIRGRGRGRGLLEHPSSTRGSLKRPLAHHHSEGPRAKTFLPSSGSHYYNTPPGAPPNNGAAAASSSGRSNLRQIQTVDEPMRTAPAGRSDNVSKNPYHYTSPNYKATERKPFVVSHKPAPSLTTIQTVEPQRREQPRPAGGASFAHPPPSTSNLRSIPTLGASVPAPMNHKVTKTGGMSTKVMISNLPPLMSFERISHMTTACGNVRTINVTERGSAIVEFANISGAENFIRTNNRKMIDRSMITVSRLA